MKGAIVLLLALGVTASAETIGFHVKLTDARSALLANPKFEELRIGEEQLQRAAGDRVLLLDRTSGVKWTWLMLSWPEGKDIEHGLAASGAATPGKDADLGLTPVDAKTFKVRCLREECMLTLSDGKPVRLKRGQLETVPFDSDLKIDLR